MRLSAFAAVTLLVLCGPGCSRDEPAPEPSTGPPTARTAGAAGFCQLTMGWDPWEPYHYVDAAGEEKGLDVELVTAIADGAGCHLSFERDSWANLLKRVADGEIDLISGATRTAEREDYAWFSEPYRQEVFVLFTRSDADERFPGSTLRAKLEGGLRLGVTDAYLYGGEVETLRDDPDFAGAFVVASIGETNVTRLVDGEIDGFLEDRFVAAAVVRRRGLEGTVDAELVVSSNDVRLMFSKSSVDQVLVERFNESMRALRAGGEFDAIQSRYLR
jgi:polar amino acid transport system substrate-binding protein